MRSWRQFFAIDEIETSRFLQTVYWVLLFGFYLSFEDWISSPVVTRSAAQAGRHVCPPYFQNCEWLYFFDGWPHSYGQSTFYALLATLLSLSAIFALRKQWTYAHIFMVPAFLWKVIYVMVLTYKAGADFEYFHIPEVFVFLFVRNKAFFVRRVFVLIYVLSATVRFSATWVVGGYFTTLQGGLPFVSDIWVPVFTNAVTVFEIVSPWLLLSHSRRVRYSIVGLWTVFHLYSIILVHFRFPAQCVPLLWALFLPDPPPEERKFSWSAPVNWRGWVFFATLFFLALVPRLTFEERLYTLQAKKFGVNMMGANYQCISEETSIPKKGDPIHRSHVSTAAMRRCDPYPIWFRLKQACTHYVLERLEWRLHVSVNGEPFYRTVDTRNVCAIAYSAFGANTWIRGPEEGAPIVGYPGPNYPLKTEASQDKPTIFPTPQLHKTALQRWLHAHLDFFVWTYWLLWSGVALVFLRGFVRSH
ncbi:MAG: hypothetical protein AB7P49_07675 [Bdellovibrionales bacterium]